MRKLRKWNLILLTFVKGEGLWSQSDQSDASAEDSQNCKGGVGLPRPLRLDCAVPFHPYPQGSRPHSLSCTTLASLLFFRYAQIMQNSWMCWSLPLVHCSSSLAFSSDVLVLWRLCLVTITSLASLPFYDITLLISLEFSVTITFIFVYLPLICFSSLPIRI